MHLIFNLAQLPVDLHESLTMLIHKLHYLLTCSFLDALHPIQLLLQQQEIDLRTLRTALFFVSGLAKCQQIS